MRKLLHIEAKIFDPDPIVKGPVLTIASIVGTGTWPPRVRVSFEGNSVDVASVDLIDAVRACAGFTGGEND